MAGRRCPGATTLPDGRRQACPVILTNGERYCPKHARDYERRRGTSAQRGYGSRHKAERAAWQARLDRGEIIHCARCGHVIEKHQPWALDHSNDRTAYLGPSHAGCNNAAGGRAAHN